jgi:hypothetical protein
MKHEPDLMKQPVVLIIRDGWGINPGGKTQAAANGDATLLAKTPFHDHLYSTYPRGTVSASGEDVGLPDGQMGNSEVGHLNLGAGRIVYQDLTRINKSIRDGELAQMPILVDAFKKPKAGVCTSSASSAMAACIPIRITSPHCAMPPKLPESKTSWSTLSPMAATPPPLVVLPIWQSWKKTSPPAVPRSLR